MEKTKPLVIYKPKAENSIFYIYCYIAKQGNPKRAEKFYSDLYEFGNSLADYHFAYPVCRQPQFAKRNMHCAVYHKNYIFIFKLVTNQLIIYNIIHSNTNPAFQSV
jgi:plasmid stabilization system protein ParE